MGKDRMIKTISDGELLLMDLMTRNELKERGLLDADGKITKQSEQKMVLAMMDVILEKDKR